MGRQSAQFPTTPSHAHTTYTRIRIHTQWGSIAQALHMLEEDGDQDELEEVDREVLGLMHSFQSNAHLLG